MKSCALHAASWAVRIEITAGLFHAVLMAKRGITLEEKLRESDPDLQKVQRELQVARLAVFRAQYRALSKLKETFSFHQQLKGVEMRLVLAREKVVGNEAACAVLAVRPRRELERLRMKGEGNGQRTASAESSVTALYKKVDVVFVQVRVCVLIRFRFCTHFLYLVIKT